MKPKKVLALSLVLFSGVLLSALFVSAQDVRLVAVIPVPGSPLTSFDISWVDQATERYFLADRSNHGVDIFNAETYHFLGRLGGFAGPSTSNDTAGPNGVLYIRSSHQVWAGDGDSTVKVFDLRFNPPVAFTPVNTGGTKRADEMAYDPRDHVLLVANDADAPPFVTFISTTTRQVLGHIVFANATNGLEQPVWDRDTQLFYLSVPELNGDPSTGEIAVINPRTMTVVKHYPVADCEPAGLAEGPFDNLLVGCSDPTNLLVLNIDTGHVLASISQVGGADEVWFNRGDFRFYVAARDNPSGPVLGVIDAVTNRWLQNVPTAFNAHSVAAFAENSHVFVPLRPPRANSTDPDPCTAFGGIAFLHRGCIGVYAHPRHEHGDDDH
jgi:hypothetical protein